MSNKISTKEKWNEWAIKLQAIAQAGLYYTKNEFERERYREIRKIACEILAEHSQIEIDEVSEYFTPETGYQTPKLDSRSVCFKDGKLLMVQESSGQWTVPGGWIDIDKKLSENLVKEAKEEAGAEVEPNFVIALSDWKSHISVKFEHLPFQIVKVFVMCDLKSISFTPNSETLQADFFDRDNLPDIAVGKNSKDQIELCFEAYDAISSGKHWDTVFD